MAIVPLRITLAFIGLLAGYWAGVILEKRWIYNSSIATLVNTLSAVHTVGTFVDEYLDDTDDVLDSFCDSDNSSSCGTDYSYEDASLGR